MIINSYKHIKNGGIEQGFLQMISDSAECNLSDADEKRLVHLKALPQNRTEIINTCEVEGKRNENSK